MKKLFTLFAICVMAVTSAWADDANLLSGKFSVSATKKVQFTIGNLYYSTTDSKYHLEAAQNATYGTDIGTYDATHVYHFFWVTPSEAGTAATAPWAASFGTHTQTTSDKFFCGVDNPMTVDGTSDLYALTKDEWSYLINTRTNASNLYKYGVSVTTSAGTVAHCLVIAPDNYNGTIADSYTAEEWATAEAAGLVCLPAAGNRNGSDLYGGGSNGNYWSATPLPYASNTDDAYYLYFDDYVDPANYGGRGFGYSVRLVKTVPVCKIGDIEYYSVQYAIAKVTEGQTIQLTMDVDLDATITVASTTPAFTLDLNGHVLNAGNLTAPTKSGDANASVIYNEGTLNIIDSNPTSTHTQAGLTDIKGGVLTGGKGCFDNSTVFQSGAFGGAIYSIGNLTITGTTLTGNSAYTGGAIFIGDFETTLSGTSIVNNTATTYAGGIASDGTKVIKVDGKINISGNTVDGKKDNLFVDNYGRMLSFGDNFDKASTIGVTVHYYSGSDSRFFTCYGKFSDGGTADYAAAFTSDNSDYAVTYNTTGNYLETVKITKLGNTTDLQAVATDGGYAELTADIDLTATITVPSDKTVTLDLNGHVLNAGNITPAGSVVENNGTLTITDNSTNGGGKITGAKSDKGGVYTSNDNLTLSGKVQITGNTKADGTTACNLYLNGASGTPRTVTLGTLATGASIGVTTAMDGTVGAYKFTTNGSADDMQYFFSDNEKYALWYNTNHLETALIHLADADVDANVTVNDYNKVLNYTLDATTVPAYPTKNVLFLNADANKDAAVNVSDLAVVSDSIYNSAANKAKALTAAVPSTSVDGFNVAVSGNVLTISADNASAFLAAQMDITLPEGITIADAQSTGHTVYNKVQEDGSTRVVIAGVQNSKFAGSTIATLTLSDNVSAFDVNNGIFTNTAFQSVAATANSTTGVVNVSVNVNVNNDRKFIENGKVVILKNGQKYNANGQRMK